MTNESMSSLSLIFRRHRWPTLATFICGISGALAYLAIAPPKNQAVARLMLSDRQLSVVKNSRDLTNDSWVLSRSI